MLIILFIDFSSTVRLSFNELDRRVTVLEKDANPSAALKILEINASGRTSGSVSRLLAGELVGELESKHRGATITRRDLSLGIPFVDEDWIAANFTAPGERSETQNDALSFSDQLVAELQTSDTIVIGVPIYNFSIPAALKAWVDMIARAGLSFRYTADGPEGLLKGKTAYLVVASGGVAVDSAWDFATPYMRHALAFVGITDVQVVAAEKLNSDADKSLDAARMKIADVVHTTAQLARRVA
jgi:FMN-dependent NADH-azoreductase